MNKYILSIFIAFSLIVKIQSQSYIKVIHEDSTIYYFAHSQLAGKHIDTISVGVESNVGLELWYKGVYYNGEKKFAGSIRSNGDNSKLWYNNSGNETLIYDISLDKGDFFDFKNSDTQAIVDTVYYLDGRKIVEFNINSGWNEPIKFIEGVGPNISVLWNWKEPGILNPFCVCQFTKSQLSYSSTNENFQNCDLLSGVSAISLNNSRSIYPNPCKGYLFLSTALFINDLSLTFRVLNQIGEIVYERNFLTIENRELNISFLPSGIYFIEIVSSSKSEILKIIKS